MPVKQLRVRAGVAHEQAQRLVRVKQSERLCVGQITHGSIEREQTFENQDVVDRRDDGDNRFVPAQALRDKVGRDAAPDPLVAVEVGAVKMLFWKRSAKRHVQRF